MYRVGGRLTGGSNLEMPYAWVSAFTVPGGLTRRNSSYCYYDKVNSEPCGKPGIQFTRTGSKEGLPSTRFHLTPNSEIHPISNTPVHLSHSLTRESHLLLDLGNRETGVETLGACPGAVENGVATVQAHGVVEGLLALLVSLVARVGEPSVGLEEDGGSEVLLRVPPVGRARG